MWIKKENVSVNEMKSDKFLFQLRVTEIEDVAINHYLNVNALDSGKNATNVLVASMSYDHNSDPSYPNVITRYSSNLTKEEALEINSLFFDEIKPKELKSKK